jgi:poly(3-hydroxybutyrate) depolymerase
MMTIGEAPALPDLPTVAGQSDQQMTVAATGELRDFTLSVPAGFETCYAARNCRRHQFPLIILLHGRGQSRARAMSWFESGTAGNVNYLISKAAFFVAPEALATDPSGAILWRQSNPVSLVDDPATFADVHFIKELVDHVVGDYRPAIDPQRVYLFGFSNGAGLVWHMLCFQHRPFRAFAAMSEGLQEEATHCGVGADNSGSATAEQQAVYAGFPSAQKYGLSNGGGAKPVIYMQGLSDRNLDPDPILGVIRNDPAATMATLTGLNHTVATPVQILNYLDDVSNVTHTTRHAYQKIAGSQGKALAYYEIFNGDHSVSSLHEQGATSCKNGTTAEVDCAHNTDYSAADEAWAFWNAAAGLRVP